MTDHEVPNPGPKKTVPLKDFSVSTIRDAELADKADALTNKVNGVSNIIIDQLIEDGDQYAEEIGPYLYQGQLRHGTKFTLYHSAEAAKKQLADTYDSDKQQHLKRIISLTRATYSLAVEAVFLAAADDDTEIDSVVDDVEAAVSELEAVGGLPKLTVNVLDYVHNKLLNDFLDEGGDTSGQQ